MIIENGSVKNSAAQLFSLEGRQTEIVASDQVRVVLVAAVPSAGAASKPSLPEAPLAPKPQFEGTGESS